MRDAKRPVATLLFAVLLSACPLGSSEQEVLVFEVGPERVACRGEMEQRCLRVREPPDAEWRNFYDVIEGFEHEPGFRYLIRVERTRVQTPVADASAFDWRLIEVIEREPVP